MDINFDYKLLAWVRRGTRRKKILKYLNTLSDPVTPKDIKNKLKLHLTKVSTTLGELREKDLVKLLNPEDHYERLYVITEKGKEMIEKLSH